MGSDRKNGSSDPAVQGSLFQEEQAPQGQNAGDSPPAEAPAPAAAPEPWVMTLANTSEGCWLETEDGTRRDLDEEAWRRELARLFARPAPPGSP